MPAGGWTDESEKSLLIATIHIMGSNLAKSRFGEVAALMNDGTSGESAYRQFIKLRKAAEAAWGPVKVDAGETPKKTPVKKGGKRKVKEVGGEEGGEDDEEESPVKKGKIAVKDEEDAEE